MRGCLQVCSRDLDRLWLWETDWVERNLPEGIHDVLSMMGQALHDTVQAPEIARNFGCLPEQLLERVRNLLD